MVKSGVWSTPIQAIGSSPGVGRLIDNMYTLFELIAKTHASCGCYQQWNDWQHPLGWGCRYDSCGCARTSNGSESDAAGSLLSVSKSWYVGKHWKTSVEMNVFSKQGVDSRWLFLYATIHVKRRQDLGLCCNEAMTTCWTTATEMIASPSHHQRLP